jgi:spore maturation protein CgeB
MRIFLIGRLYDEAFATFISEACVALGHDVVCYDPGPPMVSFGSKASFYVNRSISKLHNAISSLRATMGLQSDARIRKVLEKTDPIDLVLSTHDYLTPADARLIKSLTKAPLALWYPDPIWSFQKHMFLNAAYDAYFFKDPYIVDVLRRKLDLPVYYMPECFSPRSLFESGLSDPDPRYACDICTAGNLYAYRVAFFRNLADCDVRIWGLPPPLWLDPGPVAPMIENRFVAHAEKAAAFRSAKIVLNNLNPAEIWGTNVRTFEICGAGGFQITDAMPGLSQLFEIGREIVTFTDIADLRAKIKHYLAAKDEREAIAAAGHRRAVTDHTYAHRLPLLLNTVAGQERGYPEPHVTWTERYAR